MPNQAVLEWRDGSQTRSSRGNILNISDHGASTSSDSFPQLGEKCFDTAQATCPNRLEWFQSLCDTYHTTSWLGISAWAAHMTWDSPQLRESTSSPASWVCPIPTGSRIPEISFDVHPAPGRLGPSPRCRRGLARVALASALCGCGNAVTSLIASQIVNLSIEQADEDRGDFRLDEG